MLRRLSCWVGWHLGARVRRMVPTGSGWLVLLYCDDCGKHFQQEQW